MSEIPKARRLLLALASDKTLTRRQLASRIRRTIPLLNRVPAIRKTPPVSKPITPQKAREIKNFFYANPDYSIQKIGHIFKVNTCRVSDIMHNKLPRNSRRTK